MKRTISLVLVLVFGMAAEIVNADFTLGTPTNLGSPVNSSANESGPNLLADGLSLYFQSARSGGYGDKDLWLATRPTTNDAWGELVNLGPVVNNSNSEGQPRISADGL